MALTIEEASKKDLIKVGSKVKIIGDFAGDGDTFEGEIGEVQHSSFYVWQNLPSRNGGSGELNPSTKGYRYSWSVSLTSSNKIEIKTNKTIMTKIGIFMKKLLDADTQVLVKAGLIDGDLNLTSEGQIELAAISFMANKVALVARANEIVAEAEKKN